jgi:hypothetical protein
VTRTGDRGKVDKKDIEVLARNVLNREAWAPMVTGLFLLSFKGEVEEKPR